MKDEFFRHLPNLVIIDAIGSSESGNNGMATMTKGGTAMKSGPTVSVLGDTVVFDEDLKPVEPGSGVIGKIARIGRHPRRLLQRPGQDGRGLHPRRRQALRDAGRLRHHRGRRDDHPARAGIGLHQLGRREDLPRGGRVGRPLPPRRPGRHRGRRARRAVGPAGGGHHPAPGERVPSLEDIQTTAGTTSPATRCPASSTWSTTIERSPSGKPDYRWADGDRRPRCPRSPTAGATAPRPGS